MTDNDAFALFYARARPRLVPQIAALTGSFVEAEDVTQEAFSRAFSRWDTVGEYTSAEAWVYRVAANLARSRWRRSLRLRAYSPLDDRTEPALSADHVALVSALRALPFSQREALVLFYLGDLPVDEIARRLDVPVGTVKARLSRGRRALASLLTLDTEEVAHHG